MRRISKGYNAMDIPLFPTMLVQGPIYQGEGSTIPVESHHTPTVALSTSPPHISPTLRNEVASTCMDIRHGGAATTITSLDAGQVSGNINKTSSVPNDSPLPRDVKLWRQTKKVYGDDFTRLIKKGKMIEEIDQDAGVTLVTPTHSQEDQPEDQLGVFSAAKVLADAAKNVHTYTRRRRAVSTGSGGVSTASRLFSTNKDKGKGIMTESEPEQTKTKMQQRQEKAGYEAAHIGSDTLQQLKRLFFDELKDLFETTMRRVQTFHPIESEGDKIVPEVGNHIEAYQTFDDMLKKFDRDDLDKLWSLVKERFSSTDPTDDKERTLWVELKRLFEPDTDDIL
ncbi:hypothetical protein Tco_0787586 [Tanacetum coccineum]